MARWVGLEQDAQQLRVLVARVRRDGFSVERLLSVSAAGMADDPAEWWKRVGPELEAAGVTSGECHVATGRQEVELRRLTLPAVPDDELPDMVRLLAQTEFSAVNDQWLLDYVAMPAREGSDRVVTAAALRPTELEKWRKVAELGAWKTQQMVFGPAAAARWVYQLQPAAEVAVERQLIVQPQRDAWTLIVAEAGLPMLVRWVRRAEHQSDADLLAGELRRTRAAAFSQLEGLKIEEVVLLADETSGRRLAESIQWDESIPVRVLDPLSGVLDEGATGAGVQAGEYASLVAMLTDHQREVEPPLDFLHPHRRPEAPDRKRLYLLLAATAATLLFGASTLIWYMLGQLDKQLADLQAQTRNVAKEVTEAKGAQRQLDEWKKWENEKVRWLEEAARLAAALPDPDQVKLRSLRGFVGSQGGGTLVVEGLASDANAIVGLDESLRDEVHRVEGGGANEDGTDPKYTWKFEQQVVVIPKTVIAEPAETDRAARGARGARGAQRASAARQADVAELEDL